MLFKKSKYNFWIQIALIIGFLSLMPVGGGNIKGPIISLWQEGVALQDEQAVVDIFHSRHIAILDSVMRIYRRSYRFNGAVMISQKGDMIYNKTFGYADIGEDEKLTTEHSFQLASVSKQFTAAAIMILQEKGLLDYQDHVIKFFPDFPYEDVTIEQLLHHTGGLPNYMWMYENRWDSTTLIPHNDTLMTMLTANRLGRYFRAGRKHDYSNTGYAVLACIVEKVSGMPFADFMHTNIFKPLGMDHTFAYAEGSGEPPNKIIPGYFRRGRRFYRVEPTLHDGILGDKGIYSTGADLYKWDQSLYNATLLSDTTLEKAFSPFKIRGRWEIPYGYGFRIKNNNGNKIVYHNGLWEGFRLNFYRYLNDERTVFVMDHTNLTVTGVIARRLRTLMERTEDFHETQMLVTTALSEGADASFSLYFEMLSENPTLIINKNKIIETAYYFSSKGKFALANELKLLYDFFDDEVASSDCSTYNPASI